MSKARTRFRPWPLFLVALTALTTPLVVNLLAQTPAPAAVSTRTINLPTDPALQGFKWRSIGPVGQGGRIDDLAVDEKNPSTYFIGFAVSGVWRTLNNGTTFSPIFDTYGVSSIGDVALAPSDPNILYVGTGEANNRQTSSWGNGIWKSTNAGTANAEDVTFVNLGLKDSQSIARIIVHPKDPNIVWVAAGGHLYGPNPERGVFMTTDGGKTWNKTLFVNADTGATELVIDPANPLNLWAAMYERQRTAWGFVGGGSGSGMYASTDGGKTWKRMTGGGLPKGTMGRVGMDICKTQPNVIYAQIEVAPDKETGAALDVPNAPAQAGGGRAGAAPPAAPPAAAPPAAAAAAGAQGRGGRGGATAPLNPAVNGIWRSNDKGKTWTHVSNENQRPMYFSQIRVDPNNPEIVYVGGVNAQKSVDGGKTFVSIEANKGHVDNHAIWIDPLNSKHLMYGDDGGLEVSYDGAATFEAVRLWAVGLAYHVSADLRHPYWVCTGLQDNGSWCGPSQTRTGGIHSWNWISVGGGDGFQTQQDPTNPNVFYTESQNLGIQRYNLDTGETQSVAPRMGGAGRGGGAGGAGGGGRGGGAGAAGAAAGAPAAGAPAGGAAGGEAPAPLPPGGFPGAGRSNILNTPPADTISAFNWNSPIRLSTSNPGVMYVGGRHLFVSRDRGETWTMTGSVGKNVDLSQRQILEQSYALPNCPSGGGGGRGGGAAPVRGKPCILSKADGYVANEFGTMTELAESPVMPNVLWAGTDDGNVQVSRDGGLTWTEVGKNVPGVNHEYYVSGLEASWYDAGTAYLALDGHRADDGKPYIFKTTDYGTTWKSVSGDLPAPGWVNSIRQDPVNRNLLYAPTEFGFFISLNDGASWSSFNPALPIGRIDEVLVHPRDHDLILATHSRSVWVMDDISPLQQMAVPTAQGDAVLFKPRDAVMWKADRRNVTETPGNKLWEADAAPRGTAIAFSLKTAAADAKITITDPVAGTTTFTCVADAKAGLTRFQWALVTDQQLQAAAAGGGGRGAGGGGGGAAPAANAAPPAPTGPRSCTAPPAAGGRGGGGGGGRGGGAGGVRAGVYKVTLNVGGKDVASQTFNVIEDIWLGEK